MRHRLWVWWDRWSWVLIVTSFLLVFLAGLTGLTAYADRTGADWTLATRLYLTMQLFMLEGGGLDGELPWPLDVARWLAPLVVAGAAAGTIAALVRRHAWGWGARRVRDHVVVVGLGERGAQVVRTAHAAGRRVVVIERDAANPRIPEVRRLGVPVLVGDGADPERLRAARVVAAARMVVLVGDPGMAATVADAIAETDGAAQFAPGFCCYLAVSDAAAVRELNGLLHTQGAPVRREFFSLEGRAGVAIADRWAGFLGGPVPTGPLVVVGAGVVARSVVAATVREWEARRPDAPPDAAPLRIHWLLDDEEERAAVGASLPALHPLLADGDGVHVALHASPHGRRSAGLVDVLDVVPDEPAAVVVGEAPDADVLATLTAATSRLRTTATPIVAVVNRSQSLVGLLRDHDRIEVFDVTRELCTDDAIARGQLEAMARALHDGYLRQLDRSLAPDARVAKPAYRAWDELPTQLRDQNYEAARFTWRMLREHGYDVIARSDLVPAVEEFPDAVVDALARAEHERWFVARHPDRPVPDWATVAPDHAEQSRDQVRRIPAMLAAADLQTVSGT